MKKKTKVLIITPWHPIPEVESGAKRTMQLFDFFNSENYDVKLMSALAREDKYFRNRHQVQKIDAKVVYLKDYFLFLIHTLTNVFSLPPLLLSFVCRYYRPKRIKQLLASHDMVVLEYPYLFPWVVDFKGPKIYSCQRIETEFFKQGLPTFMTDKLKAMEVLCSAWADLTLTNTTEDKDWFFTKSEDSKVIVLPSKSLATNTIWVQPTPQPIQGKRVLGFVASRWIHNQVSLDFLVRFAKKEKQWLLENNLVFLIIGNISRHQKTEELFYFTGPIVNPELWLKKCDFGLCPAFSGPGGHEKILDYINSNLPILSTNYGIRGFDFLGNCVDVFDKDNFKETLTTAILRSDEENQKKINKAHRKLKEHFDSHFGEVTHALKSLTRGTFH